jgi:ABC-type multidrug transport system ATPase subunit
VLALVAVTLDVFALRDLYLRPTSQVVLHILTGLARATSGSAQILGRDVASAGNAARAQIGFLPDVPGFYEWMKAEEFLRFAGGLFGIERPVLNERVETLLDLAGLADVDTKIGGYSRGMKQRLGVAQALINAPRLLLLDEPTKAVKASPFNTHHNTSNGATPAAVSTTTGG